MKIPRSKFPHSVGDPQCKKKIQQPRFSMYIFDLTKNNIFFQTFQVFAYKQMDVIT